MSASKLLFCHKEDLHGAGNLIVAWNSTDSVIASCGESRLVHVFDRQGKKRAELPLEDMGLINGLEWDKDGETLAILQDGQQAVTVWNINVKTYTPIEVSGQKDRVTFIKWSHTLPVLAIGSEKGSMTYYNKSTQRKIPTVGKHSRRIVTGDWSNEGIIVTGSDDKTLSASNSQGEVKGSSIQLKAEPRQLTWPKNPGTDVNLIACVINMKNLLLIDGKNPTEPRELSFQTRYGRIVAYSWFGEDSASMLVGFSEGWFVVLNTNTGTELFAGKVFNNSLDAICVCESQKKAALVGEYSVKIISLTSYKEVRSEKVELPPDSGRALAVYWTKDGQILTVSTAAGHLYGFLMVIPSLYVTWMNVSAVMMSLNEIAIVECSHGAKTINTIAIESEPSQMALSQFHLALAVNTVVVFHRWKSPSGEVLSRGGPPSKKDFRATVKKLAINTMWAAALTEGRCQLIAIEEDSQAERSFPTSSADQPVNVIALTDSFLLLLDQANKLKVVHLEDSTVIHEFRFDTQIIEMYPNVAGTRLVVVDITGKASFYTPVSDTLLPLAQFPRQTERVIWDLNDYNVFIACEPEKIIGYVFSAVSVYGAMVEFIRELTSIEDLSQEPKESITLMEKGHKPLLLNNGLLYCYSQSEGMVKGNYLSSHSYLTQWRGRSDVSEGHYKYFLQNLAIKRFHQCFLAAEKLAVPSIADSLGQLALQSLDLEIAEKAFMVSKDVGKVFAIQSIKNENEKLVLLGHVAIMLAQPDLAQDFFLKSTQQHLALEMRCDLQDWLIALKLARSIDPAQEPVISKKLAQQFEMQGNFNEALKLFERANATMENARLRQEEHQTNVAQCYAGIARTSIRMGDITRGFGIASDLNDPQLKVDCAQVCETMKHYSEAAQLYEKGGQPEKAASLYIQLKQWKQAAQLMDLITTPKLLIQLGKAKEMEGTLKEAEEAYEKAGDWESVIRLNLQKLDNPEKAKKAVREKCPTSAAASMVADYFEQKGNRKEALEFLLLADRQEDAFVMAQSFDLMDIYAELVYRRDDRTSEEHLRIAQYFEGKSKFGVAARHYEKAGNPVKALRLFLNSGDAFYSDAIVMLGRLQNEALINQMQDFLMGETDGIPKDPKYIFQLNLVTGKLKEAAQTAILIAAEEQERGNYPKAHSVLFETLRDMIHSKLKVPSDMESKLMILHSYILVKRFIKMQDHISASRLLVRVAQNISHFPAHTVPILSSTVIQCNRSGLRMAAYEWACVLMRPEYRPLIDEKFKRQIEKVAIKVPKIEDPPEDTSPCPFCGAFIFNSEMDCESCKNHLPFCIASGHHMLLKEWTNCPKCSFPANISKFTAVLETEATCPMCKEEVRAGELRLTPDPATVLRVLVAGEEKPSE